MLSKTLLMISGLFVCSSAFAEKTIPLFQNQHIYFLGGDNQRKREFKLDIEEPLNGYELSLELRLECPTGGCDHWDRKGSIEWLGSDGTSIELMRFVTPYRVSTTLLEDVSYLALLLENESSIRLFIDTWVGPGHPQGEGWQVSARLVKGRKLDQLVSDIQIVNSPEDFEYGNPELDSFQSFPLGAKNLDFDQVFLRSYITGHGQGNTLNCAEFCPQDHIFEIGAWSQSQKVWRSNCAETKTDKPQLGTWKFPRAGWCPGDKVEPIVFEISKNEVLNAESLSWTPSPYVNEKREGYNNGGHTKPYYRVSTALIFLKNAK